MAEGSDEAAPVPPRTYGKKPHVFQFKERGKRYMIGTEVGWYLDMMAGGVYKRYPLLRRKKPTREQRCLIAKTAHRRLYKHGLPSSITLLKVSEIEEILAGRDAKYRSSAYTKTVKAPEAKHSTVACPLTVHKELQLTPSPSSEVDEYLFLTPDWLKYMDTIEQAPL
ncbi:SWI/SNF-related matrix-associated actin-dependent regulator of chromatin subfamily B member 1-like [Asterias rubens]|uniref:SWI/SNF-related matrix-associated actin-dependent regulator of chromatin subfamily B member 1-like n=1 Tax=Asterias rubens TaxID=7604 RepID=UPI001454FFA5|nr:SWI/SNF-related matrix-associated actin-dependent regulator of chromatin subfamily B member 1-like [Asterias rubens]